MIEVQYCTQRDLVVAYSNNVDDTQVIIITIERGETSTPPQTEYVEGG